MSGAPQVNGPLSPTVKYIDTIDPEDEEYQKNLRRPAEVKEDIKQMSDRSRVSLILNSEAFRRELEEIVEEQLRTGNAPASLIALQQISNLLLPNNRFPHGAAGTVSQTVIPISDIKGTDSLSYTKSEKALRCKLAGCYRLVDINGWTHGIYNHITARISQDQEHFLINPFGMNYSEITASSLIKVDIRGEVIDPGATTFGINLAGFTLHSAIHQFRPDIKCIIHLQTPSVVAVSGIKSGILPISQESLVCGDVSYHDYNGILIDTAERETLQRNLGPINKVMILRNHGIVACGSNVEEAYHFAVNVVNACNTQIQIMPVGLENLSLVSQEMKQKAFAISNQGGVDASGRKWNVGEMEFEAQMRLLDNAGYRTGYAYKHPHIKREGRRERANSDVEVPPASSSFTYVFDGDAEHSKYMSPIKAAMERQKQQHKVGWLNSPNVYVRQEVDETGTPNPKKYTKWIPDGEEGSPKKSSSTSVKLENPNQFAPQGSDPKEFKAKQKQMKKDYYEERITAGPQSKILEGLSWEEVEKLKHAEANNYDGNMTAAGDSVIVIGAASKGIIQRDQQHNIQVYKSQYAANPFETMSTEEIERYKWEIEHKGQENLEPVEEEQPMEQLKPEEKLIATEEQFQEVHQQQTETVAVSEDDGHGEKRKVQTRPPNLDLRAFISPASDVNQSPSPTLRTPLVSPTSVSDSNQSPSPSPQTPLVSPTSPTSSSVQEPPSPLVKQGNIQRSESARAPQKSPELVAELKAKNLDRSKSERKAKNKKEKAVNGDEEAIRSPVKSDTLRSNDSASGGETHSSKEGSPTKEHPSPTKEKKKKKKFFPSFSKTKKNKESKESTM